MLYQEQNYLAPPIPSVEGFKAWLERQPQDATFYYANPCLCAVGQYLASIGTNWAEQSATDKARLKYLDRFSCTAALFKNRLHSTFGDVLREVRKVCP